MNISAVRTPKSAREKCRHFSDRHLPELFFLIAPIQVSPHFLDIKLPHDLITWCNVAQPQVQWPNYISTHFSQALPVRLLFHCKLNVQCISGFMQQDTMQLEGFNRDGLSLNLPDL